MRVKNAADMSSIEGAKLNRQHIRIMLISGMSFFTDAYDLFVIGVVLLMVRGLFNLSTLQIGMLASVALFGAAIGPIIFGYIGDKIGRKYTYWMTITILIVGAIGSAFSFGFVELFLWRFILGIGIGGDYPLSATIVAEYANKNDRGKLVSSTFAMQGFGIIAGAVLAVVLLTIHVPIQSAWRILLGFGAVPTLTILYARTKLGETPWYSLYSASSKTGKGSKRHKNYSISPRDLWNKNWKYIIGTSVAWFLLDVSYYGTSIFTPYLTTFLGFSGIYGPTLASALILIIAAVPGYWVAVALIDKEGRKPIQAIGFLMMAASFIVLALFGSAFLAITPLLFFGVYGLTFFFSNYGPNTTTYVYPVELYPTQYRARGHGIAAMSGKLGAAISTLVFPLIIVGLGKYALLGMLGIVAIIGFLVTIVLLPETKRKSLLETSGENEILLITSKLANEFEQLLSHIGKGFFYMEKRLNSEIDNAKFFESVKREEHEADLIVHDILDYIANYGASSISYRDVSHLAERLDDIMDGIEAIGARFMIYEIDEVEKEMLDMENVTVKCFEILKKSIELLNEVGDTDDAEVIRNNAIEASRYENEADNILRSSLHRIMQWDDAKKIIKYKEIYEHMESLSDRCMDSIDVINDVAIRYKYITRNKH
ncbi:MAG: MFS transporter [Candidatus Marsarchaeota archaeon]|jgi:MFS family permease|nr:MFS transporter [Candidatus Marsarchaeota archaeon]